MKLFQQLLVAGAALSFIAPLAAQASDVNLEGMNNYSRKSKSKKSSKRFDSKTFINVVNDDLASINEQEAQQNDFQAGSFSDTTVLSGSAVFAATAVDGLTKVNASATESVQTMYTYTMDLNTSFTGDDNLYVRLRTGNATENANSSFFEKTASYHTDTFSSTADNFKVDKIWYSFPIADSEKFTAFIGPKIENYYMYAAPVSIYRPGFHKAFKLGSLSGAFGASTKTGAGIKYQGDNGFAASTNIVSGGAASTDGFLTKTDSHKWDTMVAYTDDRKHVSLTVSNQHHDWTSFEYYATTAAHTVTADSNATAYAARAYWRPEESGTAVPEISVGYDIISHTGNTGNQVKEATSYFVGLGWPDMFRDSDYIGLGIGQPLKVTETNTGAAADDAALDPLLWELSYSFKLNDSVTMIPAIFGASDIQSSTDQDLSGVAITTKFKF